MRPTRFNDLTLPQPIIGRLQRMYDDGNIMHMLFHGRPGLGKTSAAQVFWERYDVYVINGAVQTGVDFIKTDIDRFASSMSFKRRLKICFIDEADYLSKKTQGALRKVIERYHENCRFIFAVNDRDKLTDAIKSRLVPICFDISPRDRPEVQKRLTARYEAKLTELGISYDQQRLREIVGIWWPDLRDIANHVQFEFCIVTDPVA